MLLENVKNLVGKKFKEQFNDWLEYLDKMGYNTYWQVLNAKDYGIPQNRERVYGISIRKDIDTQKFKFPEKEILQKRLVDILEKDVDESFYLKQKTIDYFINNSLNNEKKGNGFRFKPHNPSAAEIAFAVTTRSGTRMDDNYLLNKNIGDKPFFNFNKEGLLEVREATHKGYSLADIGDSINIEQPNSKTRRGRVGKNIAQTILTAPKQVTIVASRGRNPQNPSDRKKGANLKQRLEFNSQGISNTLTTVQKDNLVLEKQILQVGTIPEEILKDNERQRRIYSPEGISPTVLARQDSPKIIQAGNIVKSGNWENPQRGRIYSPKGISPTINTRQGGGLEPKVIIDDTVGYDGIRTYENYAPTLRASRTGLKVNENIRIRKLTPLECWRLMGFDDIDLAKAKAVGVSNTQLYKQAGNSIVVNVLEKIFNNLFQ